MADDGTSRRSFGGRVVEQGLIRAGFSLPPPASVSLVETGRPGLSSPGVVLAQSAWNVIGLREFLRLSADYRPQQRARFVARRSVSSVNLRRARRVVCLTAAMADVTGRLSPRVVASPVTVPTDVLDALDKPRETPLEAGTMLVPGTVAPYKRPQLAVELAAASAGGVKRVLFAGSDDGSGEWARVKSLAQRRDVVVDRRVLSRDEMHEALLTADVVAVMSELESLGFSLAEALVLNGRVVASAIPAHVEVASRIGVDPLWFSEGTLPALPNAPGVGHAIGAERTQEWLKEWEQLGECLGLVRVCRP